MKISFDTAVKLLRSGQVVALPTETVYGLGASFTSQDAVSEIYRLKNRPQTNPLIVHIASFDDLYKLTTSVDETVETLCKAFWPGPLTLVLQANISEVSSTVRANLPSIAIRFPSHPLMQELIREVGPIVAPSANLSGKPSSTTLAHIENDFGNDFPALETTSLLRGVESTILIQEKDAFVLGRLGAIAPEAFSPILGYTPAFSKKEGAICPGSMHKHYSPNAILESALEKALDHDTILGYSDRTYKNGSRVIYLGSSDQPERILQNLYSSLRKLDLDGVERAFIDMDLPKVGLYQTVLERLERASSKK